MLDAESGWTEEQLKASAESCLSGMEEVRRDAKIDENKYFYQSQHEKARLARLQQYPAIARVRLTSELTGNELEIFVCKETPPVGDSSLYPHASMPTKIHSREGRLPASYDSAMGRFASFQVGDSVDHFYIEEIEKLFPQLDENEVIDSLNTEFRSAGQILTIKSLRQYLQGEPTQSGACWLDKEEEPAEDLVVEGVVRRKKTSFRLEFTLVDKLQDRIFVYRVIDGKAVATRIEVSPIHDGVNYTVTKGLSTGDVIVTTGVGLLNDGDEIKVNNKAGGSV